MKIRLFISALLVATLTFGTVFTEKSILAATESETTTISPQMLYILNVTPFLSISSGTALLDCDVQGVYGKTTRITVTGKLQRYSAGAWINVSSSSQTVDSYQMMFSRAVGVSKGLTYRAVYTVKAYSGNQYEIQTFYSNTVTAP